MTGWRDLIVTSRPSHTEPEEASRQTPAIPALEVPLSLPPDLPHIRRARTPPETVVHHGPLAPLQSGWLVVYHDRNGVLCGGCDDRAHGTVESCQWDGMAWTVHLTDGQQLPLWAIRSVGKTDADGHVLAAWTVKDHGYDGDGRR